MNLLEIEIAVDQVTRLLDSPNLLQSVSQTSHDKSNTLNSNK